MSTVRSYILGYALSILLTLIAFGLVAWHVYVLPLFIALAILQLIVQLSFFLHVGRGQHKEWNAIALGFAFFIIAVVVGGTLWVMQNLKHTQAQNPFINGQINAAYEND